MRNHWWVATLAVFLAGQLAPAGEHGGDWVDYPYCDCPNDLGWITISILPVSPHFNTQTAYTTNGQITSFDYTRQYVPRFDINVQFSDTWGVRASWWQNQQSALTLPVTNADPNTVIRSVQPFPGLAGQVGTNTQIFVLDQNNRVPVVQTTPIVGGPPFVVISPETYRFLGLLPTATLEQNPPQPLIPFPFTSSVISGFPDFLTFLSNYSMEVGDLEVDFYPGLIESVRSSIGLGLQYVSYTQNYAATRVNQGGTNFIPGYDPFINIDDDANTTVLQDYTNLYYTYKYVGFGPRASINLQFPITPRFRIYGSLSGALLLGNRKQTAALTSLQSIQISDIDRTPQSDLFFNSTLGMQTTVEDFRVVPMGSVDTGVELELGDSVINPLLRVGFTAQTWKGLGNPGTPSGDFGFYGVTAAFGVAF